MRMLRVKGLVEPELWQEERIEVGEDRNKATQGCNVFGWPCFGVGEMERKESKEVRVNEKGK